MHVRHHGHLLTIVALFACALTGLAVHPAVASSDRQALVQIEGSLLKGINGVRSSDGVSVLVDDPALTTIASERSEDQAQRHYYAHVTPDGQTVADLLDAGGIPWTNVGENLAKGPLSSSGDAPLPAGSALAQNVLDAFLLSPSHRANLLDAAFRRAGIGLAETDDGQLIVSVVFTD